MPTFPTDVVPGCFKMNEMSVMHKPVRSVDGATHILFVLVLLHGLIMGLFTCDTHGWLLFKATTAHSLGDEVATKICLVVRVHKRFVFPCKANMLGTRLSAQKLVVVGTFKEIKSSTRSGRTLKT